MQLYVGQRACDQFDARCALFSAVTSSRFRFRSQGPLAVIKIQERFDMDRGAGRIESDHFAFLQTSRTSTISAVSWPILTTRRSRLSSWAT